MTKISSSLFALILSFCFSISLTAQNFNLIKDYIPEEFSSVKTHPILTLKTTLHIVYRTKENPQNILANDLKFINQQYLWVNNSYKNLKKPTLLPENGETYYIPDSRIKFRLDTIIVHHDSVAWDRIYRGLAMNGNLPWKIDSIDINKNTIKIVGKWEGLLRSRGDSLVIGGSNGNDGVYHTSSFYTIENKRMNFS